MGGSSTKVRTNSSRLSVLFLLALSLLLVAHPAGFFSIQQVDAQTTTTPSRLVFTTLAQTILFGACSSSVTVQTQNPTGSPSNVASATTILLSTSSSTGRFYSDSSCTTAVSSVIISAGTNNTSFFYKDTTLGSLLITATAVGLTSASQIEKIAVKIAVDPTATAGLNYVSGSSVSIDVNVTDAPAMNSFGASVQYNSTVLKATGIDLTGNVLGPNAVPYIECIDDASLILGGRCTNLDNTGVVTLEATVLGTNTTAPTNGLLFHINFNVVRNGFSEIHFLSAQVIGVNLQGIGGVEVDSLSLDGYFSDITCPPTGVTLCSPPIPKVQYFPAIVLAGKPAFFDASKSSATNPGATISRYTWFWGDGSGSERTNKPSAYHTYMNGGETIFTLTVTDSYGISKSTSILINVLTVFIHLSIGLLNIIPPQAVTPGTIVNIKATVVNLSTRSENATVHIILDPGGSRRAQLKNQTFTDLDAGNQGELNYTWNTLGYVPKIYPVVASVDPVRNSTTGQIIQNDFSGSSVAAYVQLVSPLPSAQLSLFQAAGLGAVIILGVTVGTGFLRRILEGRRAEEEMLK